MKENGIRPFLVTPACFIYEKNVLFSGFDQIIKNVFLLTSEKGSKSVNFKAPDHLTKKDLDDKNN